MVVQASMGLKREPVSKITKGKRAGVMAPEVEHLPTKHKVISLILSTTKQNQN
jgi:hypothetical protein